MIGKPEVYDTKIILYDTKIILYIIECQYMNIQQNLMFHF